MKTTFYFPLQNTQYLNDNNTITITDIYFHAFNQILTLIELSENNEIFITCKPIS